MTSKKKCPCGKPSVPGLISSISLCQRHYNGLMFGTGKEHSEALHHLGLQRESGYGRKLK